MEGDNHEGEHQEDDAEDVGESGMGEGEEMSEQNGGGKDEHGEQCGEVLGLDAYPKGDDDSIEHQHVIEDACAGLVLITMQIEIDDACEEKQDDEQEDHEFASIQLGVVEPLERDHFLQFLFFRTF